MRRWAIAATLAVACNRAPSGAHAWLVVDGATASEVDLAGARVEGPGVRGVVIAGSRLVVDVDPRSAKRDISVRTVGACPVVVPTAMLKDGKTHEEILAPLFDVGPGPRQIGYGEKFEVTARPRCKEGEALKLGWRPGAGAPLRDVVVSADGRKFEARTLRFDELLGPAVPWGVVPISPRTRGATEIEVSWSDAQGRVTKRTVTVSAAARARGLPNVALGTRLYLGGNGFHLVAAPDGAKASIEVSGGQTTFTPDARGKWTLADSEGRLLRLVAGKYDETPLDCGRSDCHGAVSNVARTSPMATIFERGLDAKFGGGYPACAFGCHTVGEPGIDDGGFTAVLAELGRTPSDIGRTGFHDLPTALRRLSGVGCLGCHGPGAIPEENARYSILSADVCATCHDAPPRYGHVAAWRTSRMAVADANLKAAGDPECARCHTTWGFLGRPERRPHEGTAPLGIGCAACHSVHPSSPEQAVSAGMTCADALLRSVPVPPLLRDATEAHAGRTRVCLGCHTPGARDGTPAGTAAALWLGRGGVDPSTGNPIDVTAPHAAVPNGCIGCHRIGPAELERGAGHAFRAGMTGCPACHTSTAPEPAIRLRAEALWKSLTGDETSPPHASRRALDLSTPRGRAAWNVALVLEDPAADIHNAPYARRLLDGAEALAGAPSAPPTSRGAGAP